MITINSHFSLKHTLLKIQQDNTKNKKWQIHLQGGYHKLDQNICIRDTHIDIFSLDNKSILVPPEKMSFINCSVGFNNILFQSLPFVPQGILFFKNSKLQSHDTHYTNTALFAKKSIFCIQNNIFSCKYSGIYLYDHSSMMIKNSKFTGNTPYSTGIILNGGQCLLKSSTFEDFLTGLYAIHHSKLYSQWDQTADSRIYDTRTGIKAFQSFIHLDSLYMKHVLYPIQNQKSIIIQTQNCRL